MSFYSEEIKAFLIKLNKSSLSKDGKKQLTQWARENKCFELSPADQIILGDNPELLADMTSVSISHKEKSLKLKNDVNKVKIAALSLEKKSNSSGEPVTILARKEDLERIETVLLLLGIIDSERQFIPNIRKKHKQIITGYFMLLINLKYFRERVCGRYVTQREIIRFLMDRYGIVKLQQTRRNIKKYQLMAENYIPVIMNIEREKTRHRQVYTRS